MSVRSEALVREERRDTGSAFDFLTKPFKAVRRPQASSVSGSHAGDGEGPGNGRLDPNFSNVWQTPLRDGMGNPFHPPLPAWRGIAPRRPAARELAFGVM